MCFIFLIVFCKKYADKKNTMRYVLFIALLTSTVFVPHSAACAANERLKITPDDLRIQDAPNERGIYLYIRKMPSINSVLLTESAERDDHTVATYAFRTYSYHSENAQERRILDGVFIRPDVDEGYYITDSTPEPDEVFGEAFVLFLPYKMHFGYEDTRRGVVDLEAGGAYVSVRAFSTLYADYVGDYRDNSFYIEKKIFVATTSQEPPAFEEPEYDAKTVNSFRGIAEKSGTLPTFISEDKPIPDVIQDIVRRVPRDSSLDIVIALDTTKSMEDDIDEIRASLIPALQEATSGIRALRIGFVEYRDINEAYLTRKHNFTANFESANEIMQSLKLGGGNDWPEEVYAALSVAVNAFDWEAQERMVFLIGDAPAHYPPKSTVKPQKVFDSARALGVQVYPFIIPKNSNAR